MVSVALFSDVSFDKDGAAQYNFITNRCMRNGVVIPAKSPRGMFDKLLIPNDLNIVFKAARDYYKN